MAEALVRGTAVYLIIAVVFRLMPKRQTGNLSPNDLVAVKERLTEQEHLANLRARHRGYRAGEARHP